MDPAPQPTMDQQIVGAAHVPPLRFPTDFIEQGPDRSRPYITDAGVAVR